MLQGLLGHPVFLITLFTLAIASWLLTRKDQRRYLGYGLMLVLVGVCAYTVLALLQTGAVGEHPASGTSSTILIKEPPGPGE